MIATDYGALAAVHWSRLKALRRSPAHYRHAIDEARRDTPAMRLGRCAHLAVLEPRRFEREVVAYSGRRAGADWDRFAADHAGAEILTDAEYARCIGMRDAARGHPAAHRYLRRGRAEVAIVWSDAGTGLRCKGRIDLVSSRPHRAIVDLKTTVDASPQGFGREAARYGYHLQLALYREGWAATHRGEMLPVVIVAVESQPPYAAAVYRVPDRALAAGGEEIRQLLELAAHYRRGEHWPSYGLDAEQDLELPRWAGGAEDEVGAASDLGVAIR